LSNLNVSRLSTKELLGAVLTDDVATKLLHQFGSLAEVCRASHEEFLDAGIHQSEIQRIRTIFELSARYWSQKPKMRKVTTSHEGYLLLEPLMHNNEQEVVRTILLDERENVLSIPIITVGTLNSSLLHPRELFKEAIRENAHSLIIAHQHPSGDPTPSGDDLSSTKRMVDAGAILGIKVVDHIILGSKGKYFSFYEQGIL